MIPITLIEINKLRKHPSASAVALLHLLGSAVAVHADDRIALLFVHRHEARLGRFAENDCREVEKEDDVEEKKRRKGIGEWG